MCSPIDWENVGLADPSQELGLVLFEFGCGEAARARALYDAYLEAGGPGRIDRPGNFSMVSARDGSTRHALASSNAMKAASTRSSLRASPAAWFDEMVAAVSH